MPSSLDGKKGISLYGIHQIMRWYNVPTLDFHSTMEMATPCSKSYVLCTFAYSDFAFCLVFGGGIKLGTPPVGFQYVLSCLVRFLYFFSMLIFIAMIGVVS